MVASFLKKRFFSWVFLFLVFIGEPIFAQNYPITSQPLLTPRFSLKWTDFYTAPNFFRLQLTLKDKDKTNVQVYLKLKLERVGLVIKTRDDYVPSSPINLSFGSPTMLNGTDLVNYFLAENLEADGIDPAIFRQGGRLPDGFYTLTVTAFEFDATRGHRQVSNAGFTFMSNFYGYPPTITYPKEGQQLPEQVIQNTLFQWMPRATATQGGIGGLNYDFYLYELQDGEDANDVRNGKIPIYRGNTSQSSFLYGAAYPSMIAGKRYAVQVRVSDIDQQNEYYNDGFSEVVSFTYGTPCVVPTDLAVSKYATKIAKLRWIPTKDIKQYEIAYKLKDASDNTWKTQTSYAYEAYATLENSVELYEFKVRSLCSNARTSEWSELVSLPSTPAIAKNESPKVRNNTPLSTDPPSITNTTPIDKVLNPFDIPVSSETITDGKIDTLIREIRDLRSRNKIRCGYSVSDGISCEDNAINTNQGDDFTNAKGKYVYINGYEILVTRDAGTGNAHTGEGLLYYPLLGTRIPVAWQNASIYKATDDGEEYGCISDKVIAIGSQNGVVAADYRQQVIDLLTSGPHAFSGKFGEAIKKVTETGTKLPQNPPNWGDTKAVIDATKKGFDEWKQKTTDYFNETQGSVPANVQSILSQMQDISTKLTSLSACIAQKIPASGGGDSAPKLLNEAFFACDLTEADIAFMKELEIKYDALQKQLVLAPLVYVLEKGGECLTAAMVDLFAQYAIHYGCLTYKGEIDGFTDWEPIWDKVDGWQAMGACVSGVVRCTACSVIIGACEGMGREAYRQYQQAGSVENLNWSSIFGQGALGALGGYVGVKASNYVGPIISKYSPKILAYSLKRLNLTDDLIESLTGYSFRRAVLTIPTALKSINNGSIQKILHWATTDAVDLDLEQTFINQIRAATGSINDIAEQAVLSKFRAAGFHSFESKFGSNNGIDILLADNADLARAGRVLILEVKSSTVKSVPYGLTLDTGYGGKYQLSDGWLSPITGVVERMINIGNSNVKIVGQQLRDIIQFNAGVIEKYVIEVDSTGASKILKVDVL